MLFLLSEKLYHINVICVTDFSLILNIFLSKNGIPSGNYDTVSLQRGTILPSRERRYLGLFARLSI